MCRVKLVSVDQRQTLQLTIPETHLRKKILLHFNFITQGTKALRSFTDFFIICVQTLQLILVEYRVQDLSDCKFKQGALAEGESLIQLPPSLSSLVLFKRLKILMQSSINKQVGTWRSTVQSLPVQLVFPGLSLSVFILFRGAQGVQLSIENAENLNYKTFYDRNLRNVIIS